MSEDSVPGSNAELTSDDKVWAALSWLPVSPLWPLISVLVLALDEKRERPFIRYNAVLSLVTGVALIPIAIFTLGLGALGYLVFFWWAYQASQGETVEVPVISKWIRDQGWA
jgi:uncharacterized membrane protein